MLVCETGEEEGVFLAELDVTMLREYRKRESCKFQKQTARIVWDDCKEDRNLTGF